MVVKALRQRAGLILAVDPAGCGYGPRNPAAMSKGASQPSRTRKCTALIVTPLLLGRDRLQRRSLTADSEIVLPVLPRGAQLLLEHNAPVPIWVNESLNEHNGLHSWRETEVMNGRWMARGARLALCLCAAAAAVQAAAPPGADRGLIVFSSNRSGPWRIWSIRPDGSALRSLTQAGPEEQDVDPVFNPDGKVLLFTSTRGGATGVWHMPLDTAKPQRICDGDQAEWAPDGKQIVLRRHEQIFTRQLSTGRENRISPKDWPHCSGPAWSPDGKQIALACRWDAGNAIFLVAACGGEPATVYDKKGACEPHWSPDGQRIVYETETNICTIAPDGKKNRPVTYFGGVQRYGRFSPDGKSIVYCQARRSVAPGNCTSSPPKAAHRRESQKVAPT